MSTLYTIYDATTGQILRANETSTAGAEAAATVVANTFPGEAAYTSEALDGQEWWFDSDVKKPRPTADFTPLSAPISENDVRTLTGLPVGAVLSVSRPEGADLDAVVGASGEMEITFSDEGSYLVTVTAAFPFRTSEEDVNVQPSS